MLQYQRLFADNKGDPKGSRSAPETPDWAEALTCDDVHAASAPKPLPVLVCMNAVGVHIRPLPPWHTPSSSFNYSAVTPITAGGDRGAACLSHELSPSEALSIDGRPVPWQLHKVELIEVWGVKKVRAQRAHDPVAVVEMFLVLRLHTDALIDTACDRVTTLSCLALPCMPAVPPHLHVSGS
jgi:hypothetical protein